MSPPPVSNRSSSSSVAVEAEPEHAEAAPAPPPGSSQSVSSVEPFPVDGYGLPFDQPVCQEQPAPVAPEPPPGNEQRADLSDEIARKALCFQTGQANEVSIRAGNDADICGAATIAGAMVLASDTPEQAKTNAQALRTLFTDPKTRGALPEGVDRKAVLEAVDHLEQGSLSPRDLAYLQQGLYAAARAFHPQDSVDKHGNPIKGTTPRQLALMLADLKGHGATLGDANLVLVRKDDAPHWVAYASKRVLDSSNPDVPKESQPRMPTEWLSTDNERWIAGLSVKDESVALTTQTEILHLKPPDSSASTTDRMRALEDQLKAQATSGASGRRAGSAARG